MAGFNVPPKGGPVPMMNPNRLAQLAAGAFKPPGPMAMPSMSAPPMGRGGGDGGLGAGLGAGLAGLGSIASMLGPLMGGGGGITATGAPAGGYTGSVGADGLGTTIGASGGVIGSTFFGGDAAMATNPVPVDDAGAGLEEHARECADRRWRGHQPSGCLWARLGLWNRARSVDGHSAYKQRAEAG